MKYIIIALSILLISNVFFCCKSFEPIWIEELPDECNMALNIYKMYYDVKEKSAIIHITNLCVKRIHRDSCQAEVFGIDKDGKPNPVIYDDAKLYRNYGQCLSELK